MEPKPRLLILLNHTLTPAQWHDAQTSLGVEEFIQPPELVQGLWRKISPDLPTLHQYLYPVFQYIQKEGTPGDFILVQGDFGAVFMVVQFSIYLGLVPVYSTTERVVEETLIDPEHVNLQRVFKHCLFRRYEVLPNTSENK